MTTTLPMRKKIASPFVVLCLVLAFFAFISCSKEYSYEGGPITIGPPPVRDSPILPTFDPGALAGCSLCPQLDTANKFYWSFKTGNAQLCGLIDTAILNLERNTFTFFGPSVCASDSGLIFSVALGSTILSSDVYNQNAANAVFYYYKTNAPFVLISRSSQPFQLTISSYIYATKIAVGTFSGFGYRADGRAVEVKNGRFKIKLL